MWTIYSQFCVNFMILGGNEDERAKGELTRWKDKVGTLETYPHSPKQDHSRGTRLRLA